MAKNKGAKNKSVVSSQKYLEIAEIREDAVIMRDSTLRAVLLVSSVNFALKSEDEQEAIISSYVSFLNNTDFPLQIVIQSRELDINGYLEQLKQKEKEQTNELLKIQTAEYAQYIGELVSMAKIMNKRFYVVIPYNPLSDKKKNFFSSLWEILKPATLIKMKENSFLRYKTELGRRVDNVINNLASAGLNAVQLDTQSLIELYYNTYNPKTSKNQRLADVKDLRVAE
ncbi:MAG: TraC family protein [Patescibacteria group bacterium]|nr:TraC family protein [Patescibacteria group bacterium]MDD5294864.1 TraC family protein [Patescibacteria group bacterium]MDD5555042.1 TraC family protein [Patescibacteria group bacterium]